MILIIRKDGQALNLSIAAQLIPDGKRLKVYTSEGHKTAQYYIEDFTIEDLINHTDGRWGSLLVFRKEWRQ